jgi:phage protein U
LANPATDSGWKPPPNLQNDGFNTQSGVNSTLFQWGPIQFQVWPLNVHEVDHETSSDWAHKEIVGAAIYREWVGENDERIFLRGQVFPYRIGGFASLEMFEAHRRAHIIHMLMRGGSTGTAADNMGWFVCERLARSHTFLGAEGVGQQVAFEAIFARMPVPPADEYLGSMWQATPGP